MNLSFPYPKKPFALLLILTLLIAGHSLYAQTTQSTGLCLRFIGSVYIKNKYGYFLPRTEADKRSPRPKYCNEKYVYHFEGLELSQEQFSAIRLRKHRDLDNQEFSYQYRNNDTADCVEVIHFFIQTYLPIILNGKELKQQGREAILKPIPPADIISIKRRYLLFRNSAVIRITTRNGGQ